MVLEATRRVVGPVLALLYHFHLCFFSSFTPAAEQKTPRVDGMKNLPADRIIFFRENLMVSYDRIKTGMMEETSKTAVSLLQVKKSICTLNIFSPGNRGELLPL